MTMSFFGKWTLTQGANVVQIDPTSFLLKVAAAPTNGSDKFNAYGTATAFILQASNGKYVVSSGNGYAATMDAGGAMNQYSLVDGGAGITRILDLGVNGTGATQYFWNVAGNALNGLAKTNSPPATTNFVQGVVTPGLAKILAQGFQSPPDLTWVNLSGTDFTQAQAMLVFTQSILTHADMSHTQFNQGTPFDTSSAQYVNFSNATLTGCSFSTVHLENSNFTNAELSGADVSNSFLNDATLTGVKLGQDSNLANANFTGAKMQGAVLTNSFNIGPTDFTGADLTGASFTGATVMGPMTINNANLTKAMLNNAWYWTITDGAKTYVIVQGYGKSWYQQSLGVAAGTNYNAPSQFYIPRALKDALQPGPVSSSVVEAFAVNGIVLSGAAVVAAKQNVTIIPNAIKLNSNTNLTGANLQCIDFRGYDLSNMLLSHADFSGSKLDNTKLNGADMSYGDFTGVTFTGTVPMFGAILANANLTNADLTSAQMGSIAEKFTLLSTSSDYQKLLDGLNAGNPAGVTKVTQVFAAQGITLTNPTIVPSQFAPGRVWEILSGQQTYVVRLDAGAGGALTVSQPSTAAILTNAYMKGTTLTSANLYQVRASGIQLYGGAKLDGNAIVEGAQFNNGNLANINLKQAKLYGANFDYCVLNNADFSGAYLTVNSAGGQASFNTANLQGAVFSDAQLANAIFTDAAVSVAQPSSAQPAGVWLFDIPPQNAGIVISELTTASNPQFNFSMDKQAAGKLLPGTVDPMIVKQFTNKGIALSPNAVVSLMGEGPYWQIADGPTTYVIFEGCDTTNYTPALGVATSTNPLADAEFYIPYSLESDLQPGTVTPSVINFFKIAGGITLSPSAKVSVLQQYTDWQIVDTSANFSLWLGLSKSCVLQVTVTPSTPSLHQTFTNFSTPLSRRATVTLNTTTKIWAINNDSDNPFNPIVNYIKFNIIKNAQNGLDAYGSQLRIKRLVGANQQEYQNISCDVTILPQKDLVDTTICPNSMAVKSNVTDQLPFDQWMRARVLPRAPLCVPSGDGTYYCPR